MGVLIGIIRVIKVGIFLDLNNLRIYIILSDDYVDSYGLIEEEVEKSFKDYGIEVEILKVKNCMMDIDLEIVKYIIFGVY